MKADEYPQIILAILVLTLSMNYGSVSPHSNDSSFPASLLTISGELKERHPPLGRKFQLLKKNLKEKS
jgi:hypothetical protein